MTDDLIERLEDDVHLQISWEDSPRYMVETYFRDRVEAAQALKAKDDEIAQLWPPDAAFKRGDLVEKFTGEALWNGKIVSAYLTSKDKLRYVVEVDPQGFQMIAVPMQLRRARTALGGNDE